MSNKDEVGQQEYLLQAKQDLSKALGRSITWDEFAVMCEIEPRAFKTYRMPETSDNYRSMSKFVKKAVALVLDEHLGLIASTMKK